MDALFTGRITPPCRHPPMFRFPRILNKQCHICRILLLAHVNQKCLGIPRKRQKRDYPLLRVDTFCGWRKKTTDSAIPLTKHLHIDIHRRIIKKLRGRYASSGAKLLFWQSTLVAFGICRAKKVTLSIPHPNRMGCGCVLFCALSGW